MNFTKSDLGSKLTSDIEDIAGQTLITAGILMIGSGVAAPVGVGFSILEAVLCLNSVGATNPSDVLNLYYWADALPSILPAAIPYTSIERNAIKLTRMGVPIIANGKIACQIGLEKSIPKTVHDKMINDSIDKVASSKLKDFLRYMNVPGDPEAKKISMVI